MLGTIMAANVFFVIIPAHWDLIRAKEAGREPDPAPALRAKQRSVHNNYLTLPVVFAMLSNHFPATYGHSWSWLILIALMTIGAWIRHFFNLRHAGRTVWWIPVTAALGIAVGRGRDPAGRRLRFERYRGDGGLDCAGARDRAGALRPVPLRASDEDGLGAARDRLRHAGADRTRRRP